MQEVLYLTLSEVVAIHQDQIHRYGGETGIRDLGLLQSALATPQASYGGQLFHQDLYEMAAAYLFHLTKNHPFVDGNKRTAAVATYVFLSLNGIELGAEEDAFEALVRTATEGHIDKSAIAVFLAQNARSQR